MLPLTPSPLPKSCDVAFKEWAGICASIRDGRQSLILRKGGVAEGPNGFVPEHETFWLYPTFVHEAEQGLKHHVVQTNDAVADHVLIDTIVHVETITLVDQWPLIELLDDFHIWTPETVLKRFHYKRPGLWVLLVRAFVLDRPVTVEITSAHLGCKTWVPLETALDTENARAVRTDAEAAAERARLTETLQRVRPN